MLDPSRVSVLIPAYNEEASIGELITTLTKMHGWREILVVDDGSTDATADIAEQAGARVIRHPYNKGNGATVKTAARACRGEFLLLMDADGQHDPIDIDAFLDALDRYDLAIGARNFSQQASVSRGLGNSLLNKLASILVEFPIQDLTSGFRAARKDKFLEFVHLLPNGFSYPTTSTLAFLRAGYNVVFLPIAGKQRAGSSESKMRPWRQGWRFVMIILRIVTLFSPLRVFFPIALVPFVLGVGYMGYTIATEMHVTNTSVLLITGSAVVFLFGLLSEQIAALRFETKDR